MCCCGRTRSGSKRRELLEQNNCLRTFAAANRHLLQQRPNDVSALYSIPSEKGGHVSGRDKRGLPPLPQWVAAK